MESGPYLFHICYDTRIIVCSFYIRNHITQEREREKEITLIYRNYNTDVHLHADDYDLSHGARLRARRLLDSPLVLRTGPLVPFAECAVDTRRSCRTNKAKVSEPPRCVSDRTQNIALCC